MPQDRPTDLILLGGFLGAGKTTLLNRLLGLITNRPIGVIVNEFGEHGIDGALVAPGHEPVELNGGQIFCSCLSPRLLEALIDMQERALPTVLVEASGLARPASLDSLLEQLGRLAPGAFRFRGLVTVVDADRYDTLARMAPVVEEQVSYASLILVNKADLVEEARIAQVEERVREINPGARVIRTVRCNVPWEAIPGAGAKVQRRAISACVQGWPMGRPQPLTLATAVRDRADAQRRCRESAALAMRIKGYVRCAAGGMLRVDAVGDQVHVSPADESEERVGLTIIPARNDGREQLAAIWSRNRGTTDTTGTP